MEHHAAEHAAHAMAHAPDMGYAIWILLLPLIGVVINGLILRNVSEKVNGWIGSLMVIGSFGVAVAMFLQLAGLDPGKGPLPFGLAGRSPLLSGFAAEPSVSS